MDFAMQLLGSTSGLSALLAIAVQKKNLEWETWGKSPPWCNRSMERGTAGLLQGTHKTMGKGEGKKGGGEQKDQEKSDFIVKKHPMGNIYLQKQGEKIAHNQK